jgi:hypothetical protein
MPSHYGHNKPNLKIGDKKKKEALLRYLMELQDKGLLKKAKKNSSLTVA